MLTNHIRLVLDMQIILPPWELQVHVAKDNGILRDAPYQSLTNLNGKTVL